MATREIAGVRVPLIGDDEKLHRAIGRSIDDLKKLKAEIAATGTATAKQSRQVAVLEESISGMLQTQSKANSLIGGGTSVLGKMREKVSATAGALAGMSSSFGTAGGSIGKFGSIATQAFGALAVGGPVALGLAAVGAGVSYVVDGMEKKKAALEAAQKATEDHTGAMRLLDAQILAVGKSSKEQARLLAEAAAVNATTAYLGSDASKANIARSLEIQDEINAAKKRTTGLHDILTLQAEQETLDNERKTAIGRINELYEKQVALAKALSVHEYKVAHAKEKTAAATLKAYTDNVSLFGQGLGGLGPGSLSMAMGASLLMPDETTRSWYALLDAMEAVAKMAAQVDAAGTYKTPDGDPVYSASDYMVGSGGWEPEKKKASKAGGEFAKGAISVFVSGGGVSSVVSAIGGPVAGQIAGGVLSVLDKIEASVVSMFDSITKGMGKALDTVLGSSKFGGLGSTGASAAMGVLGPTAGLGVANAAMGGVILSGGPVTAPLAIPAFAGAGLMTGGVGLAAGGAAGGAMMADVMVRATMETQSYAKAMRAMNGIFHSAVQMMEPVFESFLPSIGLVGFMFRNLAQTLAPINAIIGDAMGTALFKSFKGMALTAVTVALGLDALHIGTMKAVNAFNFATYSFLQNIPGMQEAAGGFLQTYNQGVASLETQLGLHSDLATLRGEIFNMTEQDGLDLGNAFAGIGEEADTLADGFSAVSASMRNIPDFFNVARARRDSSNGTSPSADIGAAGEIGATTGPANGGFSVNDGGLYVNTLVVPSENPQQLAMRLMHASYTTSGRQVGAGEPSRTSSYRNGDY